MTLTTPAPPLYSEPAPKTTLLFTLGRGVLAGAIGGTIAGLFGYLLAEPVIDRAVNLEAVRVAAEQAKATASGHPLENTVEVFDRSTQHAGLIFATIGTGIALGVLLSVAYAIARSARPEGDVWTRCLRFGGAAWFGAYLVPFIRYPANPPGIGDPGTLSMRTNAYLTALAIGLVGVLAAARLAADLRERGTRPSSRQLAVVGMLVATVSLTYLLPTNEDALNAPAGLLWEFRLLAFATTSLLWAGLTVSFGLLEQRTGRDRSPTTAQAELMPVHP